MNISRVIGILVLILFSAVALSPPGAGAQRAGLEASGGRAGIKAPYNPAPFQNFVVSPSASVRWLLSDRGKQWLRQSPNPNQRELLRELGEDVSVAAAPAVAPTAVPKSNGQRLALATSQTTATTTPVTALSVSSTACSVGGVGVRANREPAELATFQNGESVDFKRNGVSAGVDLVVAAANDTRPGGGLTGYYVTRTADCNPTLEGKLPPIADFPTLTGVGHPVVAFDQPRNAFFIVDNRSTFFSTAAIGIFRTTAATLMNDTSCPVGTHTQTQAETCWPTRKVLHPLFGGYFHDHPHIAVDQRATGTGAGVVYIVGTEFDNFRSDTRIWLLVCNNTLTDCSSQPLMISASDVDAAFPHVSVQPNGQATITYLNARSSFAYDIKYVRCNPGSPPLTPICRAPVLVHTETQPLPFGGRLATQNFAVITHPRHDHRVDATKTETYVVWERCKVALLSGNVCPDADVVMKASSDLGVTWLPAGAPAVVDAANQDQFFPAISTDRSRNIVNIAYYTSEHDATFQRRVKVALAHIIPGAAVPDPINDIHVLTTTENDFLVDSSIGDYIGVAARGDGTVGGSRAWAGYTYNTRQGIYNGVQVPQQDNNWIRANY